MHILRVLFFVFFVCFSNLAFAIYFRCLGVADGLANPAVLSICQDSLGRMWFGTENGVSVYDGYTVKSIKPYQRQNEKVLFRGNVIRSIICDSHGDVFFKTGQEVVRFDSQTGLFYVILHSQTCSSLTAYRGEVYIVNKNKLQKWNNNQLKWDIIETIPFGDIRDILIAHDSRRWLISKDGLFVSDRNGYKQMSKDKTFFSLFQSRNAEIWVGSQHGLFCLDKNDSIIHYDVFHSDASQSAQGKVRQVAEDGEGNIWFGTFNGLYKLNLKENRFENYIREERQGSLSHASVYAVFFDRDGVLWTGTYFGGVNYVDTRKGALEFYTSSTNAKGLSHPVVGNMVEDKNGKVWICTEGGGLNMFDPKSGRFKRFNSNHFPYFLPHTNLKWLYYDEKNNCLYIGTNSKGLFSFDIDRYQFKSVIPKNNVSHDVVNIIVKDEEYLFLSTDEGVFAYSLQTHENTLLYSLSDARSNYTRYIHISLDKSHQLWICGSTLDVYDALTLKKKKSYAIEELSGGARLMRVYISPSGPVYATTYGNGILKLNPQTDSFEPFLSDASSVLLNSFCYQMIETAHHHLITLGDKGINILNQQGHLVRNLQFNIDMPISSFTRDCGLLQTKDGSIYIGGTNGLLLIKDERESIQQQDNSLYFSTLYVNGSLIKVGDETDILKKKLPFISEITLSHGQNKIEVSFASSRNVSGFNQSVYEYKMSGLDDKWFSATNNILTYTNLPVGDYVLQLRERKNADELGPIICLKIHMLPPWYLTWWAWIIWLSLLGMLIWVAIRIVMNRQQAKTLILKACVEKEKMREVNEAKLRFFTSVSHEFRTPLTLIIGQIDLIIQNYRLPPMVYNKMIKIMHQSRLLNNLITELIEFRKFEQNQVELHVSPCHINDFVKSEFDKFQEMAQLKMIHYQIQLSPQDVIAYIDVEQMRKVMMNILSNAFKFTPNEGSIVVSIHENDDNTISIRIVDNGRGINPIDIPHIFERFYQADDPADIKGGSGIGMALVKDIVERHHGRVSVKSKENYGAAFIVDLPIDKSVFDNDTKVIVSDKETSFGSDTLLYQDLLDPKEIVNEETQSFQLDNRGFDSSITVLLVEDNVELLDMLHSLFAPLYHVITAENGRIALDMVKEYRPNLVVSDVLMSEMSGIELCAKMKNDIDLCHIPIVLLTALNGQEQYLDGLMKGADDYICKPFNAQILLARCNNIIRSRKLLYKQISKQADSEISLLATNSLDKAFLEKVTNLIDTHLTDSEFGIDDLVQSMNMSRSSFYNKFKDLIGETPNDFLNTYRLKRAAILLEQDRGKSIAEISEMLGFTTPNYFCRRFKDFYNISPTQYRQSKQKKQ